MISNTGGTNKEKYDCLNKLLEEDHVFIHVNPAKPGVKLPSSQMNVPSVSLKISRLFRGRLDIDLEHLEAELLFGNSYFSCKIPFDALWGVTASNGANTCWPADIPESLLSEVPLTSKVSDNKRPVLKRIK
jgi:hypothetical protein